MSRRAEARRITPAFLRGWPLSKPSPDSDKDDRGSVLVAGGSREVPGALILSGVAALRAGAGKLQLAAPASVAPSLGTLLVEARVGPLPESRDGALGKEAGRRLQRLAAESSAVLIGPGMTDEKGAASFTNEVLRRPPRCALVIDAACIGGLPLSRTLGPSVILTPHAGEMAALIDEEKTEVERSPERCAREVARSLGATIVLKGPRTFIVTPSDSFVYEGGDVGLATSGSGDVLAGILAGLLARGAEPLRAAAWAVFIHGSAGNALARKVGQIGFLARELLDEIPRAMTAPSGKA